MAIRAADDIEEINTRILELRASSATQLNCACTKVADSNLWDRSTCPVHAGVLSPGGAALTILSLGASMEPIGWHEAELRGHLALLNLISSLLDQRQSKTAEMCKVLAEWVDADG